jgi:large repetitive protein
MRSLSSRLRVPGRMRFRVVSAVVALAAVGAASYLYAGQAWANPVATTTALTSSVNPSFSGQPVTLTATVSEQAPNSGVPTGSVRFVTPSFSDICQGGTDTEPLTGGVAQCVTTGFRASAVSSAVSADYLGDSGDLTSVSNTVTQAINPAPTTVGLTSTAVFAPVTQSGCALTGASTAVVCPSLQGVTVGASVTATGGGVPAAATVAALVRRTNSFTLSTPATTSVIEALTFVDNPTDSSVSGHAARFTASVTPSSPGSGTPTGKLTWSISGNGGTTVACSNGATVPLNRSGIAICQVPAGQLVSGGGPYSVMASYAGDGNYSASSQSSTQTITPTGSKTYVAGSPMPPLHGTVVHFTASVVPAQSSVVPTGTVQFTFSSAPFVLSPCTLTAGSTSVTCGTSLSGVIVNDVVSDSTTPTALLAGTKVTAVGSGSMTLSAAPSASSAGQKLSFTPASSPTLTCDGGSNTIALAPNGATCTVTGGLPLVGSPFNLVASYSGDANDAASASHALNFKVH